MNNPIWMRNCWQVAGFAEHIDRKITPVRIMNEAIILYRTEAGDVVAMQDRCPHRLVPLSIGKLKGDVVRCGYHGMEFGPDGHCVAVPAQDRIPGKSSVKTYPVIDRFGFVWIWMGKPELADPALVPDVNWMTSPGWTVTRGYKHMECDYRLITDNLLDLSHEAFVHEATIGNEHVADDLPKVVIEHDSIIRAKREMIDIAPPPFFAKVMGHDGNVDRWQTAVYMPPGLNMTEAGVHATGTSREDAFAWRVLHMITPETETTAHYNWALIRNYRLDDEELSGFIYQAVSDTFDEDKEVLELQMKGLQEASPEHFPFVAIMLDEAPVRARRMLERLIKNEQENADAVFQPVTVGHDPIGMEPA